VFVTGVSTHEGYTFERDVTIRFGEEAIAGRTSRATGTRGGQRLCSSLAIETSLTPSAVFALAPRQTGGFAGSLLRLPGLDHAPVPDHGTLSRRARERDARVESAREFGRRAWKKQVSYHQQARVESSFYRYRQLIGGRLGSRNSAAQDSELGLAIKVLNRELDPGESRSEPICNGPCIGYERCAPSDHATTRSRGEIRGRQGIHSRTSSLRMLLRYQRSRSSTCWLFEPPVVPRPRGNTGRRKHRRIRNAMIGRHRI